MSSLATLVSKLRNEVKIDPNDRIWSQSVKENALNRAYFQVQKDGNYDFAECVANYTFSSVVGTQEYAKPSDFIRLDLIRFNGNYLLKREKVQLKQEYANGFTQGLPNEYYLYGSYIGMNPIPNSVATVDLDYRKKLPTMTSSVDSAFPVDFDDAIVQYAAYILFKQIRNIDRAKVAIDDYQTIIATLVDGYIQIDNFNLRFRVQRRRSGYVTRADVLDYFQ